MNFLKYHPIDRLFDLLVILVLSYMYILDIYKFICIRIKYLQIYLKTKFNSICCYTTSLIFLTKIRILIYHKCKISLCKKILKTLIFLCEDNSLFEIVLKQFTK
jgi:hypothetical protein